MRNGNTLTNDINGGDLQIPVTAQDHVQGPDTAPVTLVEYADYECPYSRRAYPVIKELQRELGDQLRSVYRNFPLQEIHPHAQHAAEAAEAAATQGRFWEMHDSLFEHQYALDDAHLRQYALVDDEWDGHPRPDVVERLIHPLGQPFLERDGRRAPITSIADDKGASGLRDLPRDCLLEWNAHPEGCCVRAETPEGDDPQLPFSASTRSELSRRTTSSCGVPLYMNVVAPPSAGKVEPSLRRNSTSVRNGFSRSDLRSPSAMTWW